MSGTFGGTREEADERIRAIAEGAPATAEEIAKLNEWATADRRRIAHHEAGHAVAAFANRMPFRWITTNVGSTHDCQRKSLMPHVCRYKTWRDWRVGAIVAKRALAGEVTFMLAGGMAVRILDPSDSGGGPENGLDFANVVAITMGLGLSDDEGEALMVRQYRGTERLVRKQWASVVALATALEEHEELSGTDATKIIAAAWRKPKRRRIG